MKTLIPVAYGLLAVAMPATAQGAGFAVDVQSARATGMAAAVTGGIDDASAAYFNPAGLAQGRGLEVQTGGTLLVPYISFTAPDGAKTSVLHHPVPPATLYASYGLSDDLTLGLGIFSAYGLALTWPNGWAGRFLVQSANLRTYDVNPEVAFHSGRVRLGIGIQVVRSTVELERSLNFITSEGTLKLGGGAWGTGGNVGLQVALVPKVLTFGAAYRSQVDLPFSGDAHFAGIPVEFQSQLKDQGFHSDVTLPDSLALGLSYRPLPKLLLGLDSVYTAWQRFGDLALSFDDPSISSVEPKRWTHVWNFHLGGEYAVRPNVEVRAGAMYDPSPSPESTLGPDIPDANRVNLAIGAGYGWRALQLDLGYQLVIFTNKTSTLATFPGSYQGTTQILAVSMGYRM